jgi:hypothetical protein
MGGGAADGSAGPSDQKYVYSGQRYVEAHPQMAQEMPSPVQNLKPRAVQAVGELPAAHQHYYAELPSDQAQAGR